MAKTKTISKGCPKCEQQVFKKYYIIFYVLIYILRFLLYMYLYIENYVSLIYYNVLNTP